MDEAGFRAIVEPARPHRSSSARRCTAGSRPSDLARLRRRRRGHPPGRRRGVLLLGGGRALLMQLAHPSVATGVAEHSDFAPTRRPAAAHARGDVTIVFGTRRAGRAGGRPCAVHERVTGEGYRPTTPRCCCGCTPPSSTPRCGCTGGSSAPVRRRRRAYYAESTRGRRAARRALGPQPPDLAAFRRLRAARWSARSRSAPRPASWPRAVLHPPVPAVDGRRPSWPTAHRRPAPAAAAPAVRARLGPAPQGGPRPPALAARRSLPRAAAGRCRDRRRSQLSQHSSGSLASMARTLAGARAARPTPRCRRSSSDQPSGRPSQWTAPRRATAPAGAVDRGQAARGVVVTDGAIRPHPLPHRRRRARPAARRAARRGRRRRTTATCSSRSSCPAVRLAGDGADRLDLKITNAALKEMRGGVPGLRALPRHAKVTIFGSARTLPDDPLYAQARDAGRAPGRARAGWSSPAPGPGSWPPASRAPAASTASA